MKRILISALVMLILLPFAGRADEGMWLPLLIKRLNYADMQSKGLQLSAEEIYSVNNSSLKDAIVSLGGFCTAEMISGEGLMLTNHHCAFDAIQSHSTTEHDYLTDGFWAMNRGEELAVPGLTASFLVRMEDVTDQVLADVQMTMTEAARAEAVRKASQEITAKAKEGNDYRVRVRSFFEGNEFYLFVYEVYEDVRLVGAPPSSIGKYGGDTDNWMWPRHTGDFAMLRVYAGADNKPAEYSADNKPMKPRHHLPIAMGGVKEGDFSMIMGYPGSTDRFLSSHGVSQALSLSQPEVVKIRTIKLDLLKEDMDADDEVRIKYASKYAQVSNYWKYFIGQQRGLKRLKVYDKKKAEEDAFEAWVAKDADRQKIYGDVIPQMKAAYDVLDKYALARTHINESVFGNDVNIPIWTMANSKLTDMLEAAKSGETDEEKKAAEAAIPGIKARLLAQSRRLLQRLQRLYRPEGNGRHAEALPRKRTGRSRF